MSATEVINDQMEKMRSELATANQQIGIITACADIQEKILQGAGVVPSATTADRVLNDKEYDMLVKMASQIHTACRRA